jgi:hypothetical protein
MGGRSSAELEVLIQDESLAGTDIVVSLLLRLGDALVNARLLIIAHALFKEVGLALERDHVHEIEGIRDIVDLFVAESDEETIGDELDVLAHEGGVHADERNWKCI